MIPGENGTLEPGKGFLNHVWYCNYAEDSRDLSAPMTDIDGRKHHHTVPICKINPEAWQKQKAEAARILPRPYVELITKTSEPFVTTVTDIASPQAYFYNGKLLLVRYALVPFRPRVACSTNQAALDAMLLDKMLRGEISLAEWESEVMAYAHLTRLKSITWGSWYQFGLVVSAFSQARYLGALAIQKSTGFLLWALVAVYRAIILYQNCHTPSLRRTVLRY